MNVHKNGDASKTLDSQTDQRSLQHFRRLVLCQNAYMDEEEGSKGIWTGGEYPNIIAALLPLALQQ